ncbi:hypothetical protein ACHAXM_003756 [Skeletonema potamos]|jgi:hypothetical protein
MFSDLRARLQPLRTEVVSEADVEGLKFEIAKLQKQLHQIVDQEIASNNEACGVATNGIVQLNIEMEKLTKERCRLNEELGMETEALKALERQFEEELDTGRKCQEDVVRLRSAAEAARAEINTLHAEIDHCIYFQERVDSETFYRLKADVQNLETDKDRDIIRLRHLKSEREELQSALDQLAAERDAYLVKAQKLEKELQDERMTHDMYKTHHEALYEHAERLGVVGKVDNVIASFKGFFMNRRVSHESNQPTDVDANNGKKMDMELEQKRRDSAAKSSSPSDKSPAAAVGGIAYADSVPSSDLFRKTPKIFKIGGGSGSNFHLRKSTSKEEMELSINKDESSAQSSITMSDDDEVTASMTENSPSKR